MVECLFCPISMLAMPLAVQIEKGWGLCAGPATAHHDCDKAIHTWLGLGSHWLCLGV